MERKRPGTVDEDLPLIESIRKGNTDDFEVLVRKYEKKMMTIAYRLVGEYEDASEVVQDAFVSAYRALNRFEGKARFSTWLYRIVVNCAKNRVRQRSEQGGRESVSLDGLGTEDGFLSFEVASGEPSALERLEKRDLQRDVQECINRLGIDFREVIVLRDIQGLSYEEIGDVLGLADGTVKSRLSRGREMVKNCLKIVLGRL